MDIVPQEPGPREKTGVAAWRPGRGDVMTDGDRGRTRGAALFQTRRPCRGIKGIKAGLVEVSGCSSMVEQLISHQTVECSNPPARSNHCQVLFPGLREIGPRNVPAKR